jgi:hypothetical protein
LVYKTKKIYAEYQHIHIDEKLNILFELDNIKDSANNALNAGNYDYNQQLL